jgi:hypothetical protein
MPAVAAADIQNTASRGQAEAVNVYGNHESPGDTPPLFFPRPGPN